LDIEEITMWIELILQFCSTAISADAIPALELIEGGTPVEILFSNIVDKEILFSYYLRKMGLRMHLNDKDETIFRRLKIVPKQGSHLYTYSLLPSDHSNCIFQR
jgi:hypothetical protein